MILFLGDYLAKIIQQTSSLVLKYICQVKLMLYVCCESIIANESCILENHHFRFLPNSLSFMLEKLKDTNLNNFRSVPHSEYILIELCFV